MLVGTSGSGKSYYAYNYCNTHDNCIVVSSDDIREEIYGSATVQDNPNKVFEIARTRCVEYLTSGKDVILDATNLNRKQRRAFLMDVSNRCRIPIKKVCTIIACSYEDCLEGNNNRERKVPIPVIRNQFSRFQMPLMTEGWDEIHINARSHIYLADIYDKLEGMEHDHPGHTRNVKDHMLAVTQYILNGVDEEECADPLVEVAYWHDVGKLYTKVWHDADGNPSEVAHFYGHEGWSTMMFLCSYYCEEYKLRVAPIINLHMMHYQAGYENFIKKWCPELKDDLDRFNKADRECA